ncbi:MAG: tRNA 2-thiouridine(34) synthase MnmA [Patescibacteria group bacterium]
MSGIRKKVYVGMSGGVDSSVSAALLKKAGYEVVGVFIKVWQPDWITCTWKEDRLDAMRVAAKLEIPFETLDLEKEYKEGVVDYMIREYKSGRTPNPDVMCNRYVKFGGFFNWAMKQGADFVATGHYAQIKAGKLVAGDDKNKDQSYFLWTLTKDQLSKTLFPVGNIEKPEVRKHAKKFKLPNADKKDSQGLCFIGKIDIKDFLSHYIEPKRGDVLDENGNVIGEHDGAFFFTIGERHGFTITKKSSHDQPYYVIAKNLEKNAITVANKTTEGSLPNGIKKTTLSDINWNQGSVPLNKILLARSRYREELQEVKFTDQKTVEFVKPQYTLSAGQSLVVYDGEACLGGGILSA